MEQVIQFVTTRINDVKSIAREMVGIECTHHDADNHTSSHQQGHKSVIV
jgi:hypothetical protein